MYSLCFSRVESTTDLNHQVLEELWAMSDGFSSRRTTVQRRWLTNEGQFEVLGVIEVRGTYFSVKSRLHSDQPTRAPISPQ